MTETGKLARHQRKLNSETLTVLRFYVAEVEINASDGPKVRQNLNEILGQFLE